MAHRPSIEPPALDVLAQDVAVAPALRPLTAGAGGFVAFLAVMHAVVLPPAWQAIMVPLAAVTAALLLAGWLALRRWGTPTGWNHAVIAGVALLLAVNSFALFALKQHPEETTSLMLIAVGSGALLLRARYLFGVLILLWLGWGALALAHAGPEQASAWVHFAFALLGATVVALVLRAFRYSQERILHASVTELRRSNEELDRFASAAAHDLRAPLQTILGNAQLLREIHGEGLDDSALQRIDRVVTQTRVMSDLLDEMLSYARLAGEPPEPESVDLDAVVRRVLEALEGVIADVGARVTTESLPPVRARRAEVERLLQNLVQNALEHGAVDAPRVHLDGGRHDGTVTISVADNGAGIPPQDLERIFQPFERTGRTESSGGSGLGLAICARIVARHGGRIWVESEEGRGATFHVTLPADEGPAEDAAMSTRAPG